MEGPLKKRRLLFLNADAGNPGTQRRTRSKSLDSKVRRHLMVDIGMSRRKPSKAPQFVSFVWSVAETSGALSGTGRGEHSTSREVDRLQAPAKDLVVPGTVAQYTTLCTASPPILHALSVFEKEWGEDSFSAYGFALIMVAGRNAMSSSKYTQVFHPPKCSQLSVTYWDEDCSATTFWFPFAVRKSAFLHHYQKVLTSPNVLIPLYRRSARELRSLALERSLETIQCVESRLSSPDTSSATSDSVLHAVLALICYNFISMDFDQAMIHVKGLRMVVAARGGISTLKANQDLMLMISWVDITAALLHDTKPLFPLFAPMASAMASCDSTLETLPAPLLNVINDENTADTRFMDVISCIGDLNALAALIRFELAIKGNAIWDDEEHMSFFVNPVAHKLLNQSSRPPPITRWDSISRALRVGTMIWVIEVKRKCRSYPGTADARISTLLKMLSSNSNAERVWNTPDLRLVRLWLLVLCSIGEPNDKDLSMSMRMIASEMEEPRPMSWVETMAGIRQMPWVDIFEPACAKLGQRLLEKHFGTSV
ncbi:hypothetical protein S40288_06835 [Stachybotrys chartarum IBT 40288]|nr:hypothetical protein S40288_06835 [Stachybotrys chartarum IBT 40288]